MISRSAWLFALVLPACGRAPPAHPPAKSSPGLIPILARGEELFWRDQFDSARVEFHTAFAGAEAVGDSVGEARALTWLSRSAYRLGDYEGARRDGERGLDLKQRLGMRAELFESWNTLGLLAWNQGRLIDAESLLTEASRAAAAVDDRLSVGKAAANRGLVQVELGDYQSARAGFEAMRDAGRQFKDARVTGNALANLAMLDIREGDPRSALPRLAEARSLYRTVGYETGEANALGQLATAWRDMGDYQAALAASDSALDLARRVGLKQEEAAELEVIATLHQETGDLASALRRLAEAQRINDALDLRVETGTDRRRVAEIQLQVGQRAAAIAAANDALKVHAAVGAHPERLADLLFLATADSARANYWLRQARTLADSLKSRQSRAQVSLTEADVAVSRHDWEAALGAIRSAGFHGEDADPGLRWQVAEVEATAELALGRLAKAEAAAKEAVEIVERIRGSLGASWSRARFLASRVGSYARLAEIELRRNRLDEAFATSDAARGRALLEHLAGIDTAEARGSPVLASLAAMDRTLHQVDDLERQLAAIDDDASPEAAETRIRLRRQLSQRQAEYADLSVDAASDSPAAALLGSGRADLKRVKEALGPDEALIEFLIGSDRLHAFVVRRSGLFHLVLPGAPADLSARVRIARDILGRPGPYQHALPVLGALYRQLIEPLRRAGCLDGTRSIVIVPQGVLGYLPFAALRDPARGRYLIEDVAIATAPSAASIVALRRPGIAPRDSDGVVALAPFPDDLPGTSAELDAIERAVPNGREVKGPDATELAVRTSARSGSMLHLATHGTLNPDNPLFSRVELRPGRGLGSGSDGRLEVHEVLGLRVTSRLIYLSGCETAVGQMGTFTRGDDLVTLAQSFLFAGARAVVATLWRVPDAGSVPLVEGFYRRLEGRSPPEALAEAQRELIRSSDRRSPYFWAGFVLSGEGGSAATPPHN